MGLTRTQGAILFVLGIMTACVVIFFIGIITSTNRPLPVPSLFPSITPPPISANIDITIEQTSDNLVLVSGQTNLPDGTIIMVSVKGDRNDFSGQDKVTVSDGNFTAGPFGPYGGLSGGNYSIEALMPYPKVQPLSVQQIIGSKGEHLSGNQLVYEDGGILVLSESDFKIILPTMTPRPSPVPTPTPMNIYLSGGDIGTHWSNDDYAFGLVSVYRTDKIDEQQPSRYREGFTQFLVLEFQFERYKVGYDDYDFSHFWVWAYSDDKDIEYGATKYPPHETKRVQVYYQETIREHIAFEIVPASHNFIFCYQQGIGIDFSGKLTIECGSYGRQFKFGD